MKQILVKNDMNELMGVIIGFDSISNNYYFMTLANNKIINIDINCQMNLSFLNEVYDEDIIKYLIDQNGYNGLINIPDRYYLQNESKINRLISLLKELETSGIKTINFYYSSNTSELVSEIKSIAYDVLISNTNEINYKNKKTLEENGFEVYPGETDSYKWVPGCIVTKTGIIIFA